MSISINESNFTSYPLEYPFAYDDADKNVSVDFLENGFADSHQGGLITRHELNGLGYIATLSGWMKDMCIPNDMSIGQKIGGYPLGAVKAHITEDGEYREYMCCKENNMYEPPFSESVPPIDQKNFWRPTKGYWNTMSTPGYYKRDVYSGANNLSHGIGVITREDEEMHTGEFNMIEGEWVEIIRKISNWDSLSPQQRKSRYPMAFVNVSYATNKSYRCLAIPFCLGKEVVRWLPFPKGRTMSLTIQGDNMNWPHAKTYDDIQGFGSMSLYAYGHEFDRFDYSNLNPV